MDRIGKILACGVVALAAGTLAAQPPEGKGGDRGGRDRGRMPGVTSAYVTLLEHADAQKELGFSADDKAGVPLLKDELKKIDEAYVEELRASFAQGGKGGGGKGGGNPFAAMQEKSGAKRKEGLKVLKEGLGDDKFKRFMELYYQNVPLGAFGFLADAEVAKKLDITQEQSEKFRTMRSEASTAAGIDRRKMFEAGEEERAAMQKKSDGIQKEVEAKFIKEVLSEAQRRYLDELRGKPSEVKVTLFASFGGGRGGPGGSRFGGGGFGGKGGDRPERGGKGGDRPEGKDGAKGKDRKDA